LRSVNFTRASGRTAEMFDGVFVDSATRGVPAPSKSPPPDFDLALVKIMILKGEAPPPAWWPFITELDFSRTSTGPAEKISDVSSLAGLTALQSLYLMNTQVRDVSPLAGLTTLRVIGPKAPRRRKQRRRRTARHTDPTAEAPASEL